MDDAGWTEECYDRAERLIPTLVEAGYVRIDNEIDAWSFTQAGVSRAKTLEAQGASDLP
jgi:hypothetical protein